MAAEVMEVTAYQALALQLRCRAVNGLPAGEARACILRSIGRIGVQLKASKVFIGSDLRLVVLPEYFLTGFPMRESVREWQAIACLRADGPEYEALSKLAQEGAVYLCGNVYEIDDHFPELYFQTCFVIAPSGEVVLRYRRLISMFAPTPHDVWDKYLAVYGLEGVFPVAATEIGRLAAVASEEILYPELARCLTMRGAEVLLHASSEASSPQRTQKEVAKVARAVENMAYVVSSNSGGMEGNAIPGDSTNGKSTIIGPQGHVLAEAAQGESMVAHAEIDLLALRRFRRRPGMANLLARQRFELYAGSYAKHSFYPPNTLGAGLEDRRQFVETQLATIERLAAANVI